jgi:hypothetical protein
MTRHVLLSNAALRGVEYGILRDFEDEIVRLTDAERVGAPVRRLPPLLKNRLDHGTRYAGLRRFVPKENYRIEADVLWLVLMSPENFTLDLFDGWDENVGIKALYIFDTFEVHLKSIQRVLKSTKWDYTFTAFQGAKDFLDRNTDRTWELIHQGIKLDRFAPPALQERPIGFCSYGRQLRNVHNSIREFCDRSGIRYDFNTTVPILEASVSPQESYARYAWHLSQSTFNFCWPLDVTNPERVKTFSPISPRYFEAAASANVIIGQPANDKHFDKFFGRDAVIRIDPNSDENTLRTFWTKLWEKRALYLKAAIRRREELSLSWTWETRVTDMLRVMGVPLESKNQAA